MCNEPCSQEQNRLIIYLLPINETLKFTTVQTILLVPVETAPSHFYLKAFFLHTACNYSKESAVTVLIYIMEIFAASLKIKKSSGCMKRS